MTLYIIGVIICCIYWLWLLNDKSHRNQLNLSFVSLPTVVILSSLFSWLTVAYFIAVTVKVCVKLLIIHYRRNK
jgi:hypothetical protein